MKPLRLLLIALLLPLAAFPVSAADPPDVPQFVTPLTDPIPAVPAKPIPIVVDVGKTVDIPVKGIASGTDYDLSVKPDIDGGTCRLLRTFTGDTVFLLFSEPTAGNYTVKLLVVGSNGKFIRAMVPVTVGTPLPPKPPEPPQPPQPPKPPEPPVPTLPTLTLITTLPNATWQCEACNALKADTLPALTAALGSRLSQVSYDSDTAKKEYPQSALVPRWVLHRPDGTVERKIGYQTVDQVNAWIGGH
jgi:hypothetical protein